MGKTPVSEMTQLAKRKLGEDHEKSSECPPLSLSRPISPPRKRQRGPVVRSSPWQLTWIRDLPDSLNQDAVTLKDILGDPLISDCWEFNYLHDIHFLMDAFDPDTRHIVNVHVVHGFWKQEDPNRRMLSQEASGFSNVELHAAFMPEMFGTHHSKMMVLFRHDDTAQVVIHTANMIPKDWTNMTNGVWRSPLLPLAPEAIGRHRPSPDDLPIGSGARFKVDLLNYLRFYDRRKPTCKSLSDRLLQYDFSAVKAALIASVPGRHDANDTTQTSWGWSALKRTLRAVPCSDGESEIVAQISSVATLGAKDDWLQKTLLDSLRRSSSTPSSPLIKRPQLKVVFPTPDEIRQCLGGYPAGASIHMKIQSHQQSKQLDYMRPLLHHWANDSPCGKALPQDAARFDGGRARAAPHIKTYVRYNEHRRIDWALLTSANLSKQAWGEAERSTGEMRISSWEIGVLVWPDLMENGSHMEPTFRSDTPDRGAWASQSRSDAAIIGLRIPYNLPLQQYDGSETPWVTTMTHTEPDRFGGAWVP